MSQASPKQHSTRRRRNARSADPLVMFRRFPVDMSDCPEVWTSGGRYLHGSFDVGMTWRE